MTHLFSTHTAPWRKHWRGAWLCRLLKALIPLRGRETVRGWQAQARAGEVPAVFTALMHEHYDPGYLRSMQANFAGFAGARVLELPDPRPEAMRAAAAALIGA